MFQCSTAQFRFFFLFFSLVPFCNFIQRTASLDIFFCFLSFHTKEIIIIIIIAIIIIIIKISIVINHIKKNSNKKS